MQDPMVLHHLFSNIRWAIDSMNYPAGEKDQDLRRYIQEIADLGEELSAPVITLDTEVEPPT